MQEELWDGNVTLRVGGDGEPFTLPVWETQEYLDRLWTEYEGKPWSDFYRAVIAYVQEQTGVVINMGTAHSLRRLIAECLDGKKKSPPVNSAGTPSYPSSTDSPSSD